MRNFIDWKIRPFRLRIFFDEKYVNTRVSNIDRAGREIDWWKFIVESHLTTLRTFFSPRQFVNFSTIGGTKRGRKENTERVTIRVGETRRNVKRNVSFVMHVLR